MTPQRWAQIESHFNKVLELNPTERTDYLASIAEDDADLRQQVEALLGTYEDDPEFLEEPILQQGASNGAEEKKDADLSGSNIGSYRLIRRIGKGGMGQVYLAVRDGEFKQYVALKLINRGMDTEDILRRFRTERQILASLDHPNIARVLDGGMTSDGLPYFVMRFIEGIPIDRYCDQNRLGVDERLTLFQKVCDAVHYAHQNLIVHRDLKPTNILVTPKGEPVLLDFGIAKVLNRDLSIQSVAVTQTSVRLMTPDYASPEQVRGRPITTASDVYALGVLLYRLLTGHKPYRLDTTIPRALEKIICEDDPERPSSMVTKAVDVRREDGTTRTMSPVDISASRNTLPERLRRRLKGDLDNIVMMAMRKEPRRRYASVERFSEDIRRYQAGLPVMARSDTFGYRSRKFIMRHRFGVAALTVIGILLIGFTVVTIRQSRQVAEERDKAETVATTLTNLFRISEPSIALGQGMTARDFLNLGERRIEKDLAEQPEIQAELLTVVSEAYMSVGAFDDAERLAMKSMNLRSDLFGPEHPTTASSMMALGNALFYQAEDFDTAETVFREALAIRKAHLGDRHPAVAETLNELAKILGGGKGDYATAAELMREALELRIEHFGPEHLAVAESQNDLGKVLIIREDYEAAEPVLRASLATRRKLLAPRHLDLGESLDDLAQLLYAKGDYVTAESLYKEALEIRQAHFGQEHLNVAKSLINLARCEHARGNYDAAEMHMRDALAMDRKLLHDDHPYVAHCLHELGTILQDKGDIKGAEAAQREALTIYRASMPDHPITSNALLGLSEALLAQGQTTELEGYLGEALRLRRYNSGDSSAAVAEVLNTLGAYHAHHQQFAVAETMLLRSHEILRKERGNDRNKRITLQRLVALYEAWGQPEKAPPYRELLSINPGP